MRDAGSNQQAGPAGPAGRGRTDGDLPCRYDGEMAGRIESQWQERWAAEGTYHPPSPCTTRTPPRSGKWLR
jgi:leucyl-tRNA synthetase